MLAAWSLGALTTGAAFGSRESRADRSSARSSHRLRTRFAPEMWSNWCVGALALGARGRPDGVRACGVVVFIEEVQDNE